MKQKLTKALDGLDASTRRAAELAAANAGMPLEQWLESAVSEQAGRDDARASLLERTPAGPSLTQDMANRLHRLAQVQAQSERRGYDDFVAASAANERRVRETVEKTATALDSVAAWIERAEGRFGETKRVTADSEGRTAALVSETIAMVARRLDEIESKIGEGSHASLADAVQAIERIEGQLSAPRPNEAAQQGAQIEAALRGFEDRIGGLTERLTTLGPRPLGRRGVPAGSELNSAVSEIRSRQAELDQRASAGAADDLLRSLRDDMAVLSGRLETAGPIGTELASLRSEMTELQEALRPLARREDVEAIESSIKALSSDVSLARSSGQGPDAILAPLETLQSDVQRLIEEVAPDTHSLITRSLDRFAAKLDLVAGAGVEPAAIDSLSVQLMEMRGLFASMPGPAQVDALTRQIAALTEETSALKTGQIDAGDFASVKQAIEEIRTSLAAPQRGGRASKTADLDSTVSPLQSELERLSQRMEGLEGTSFDLVAAKLDRIEENIRRSGSGMDLRESLLAQLAEKLEKAERPGAGRDAMEALERQVEAIASRLDRGLSGDPALASLERVMNDLLTQVGNLRDGTLEAAELAARNAVAGTLTALPQKLGAPAGSELGVIKRDMTDIKALQDLSDKRTRTSLDTLQSTLDKLLARLDGSDDQTLPALPSSASSRAGFAPLNVAEPAELRVRDLPKAKLPEPVKAEAPAAPAATGFSAIDEILLEPGAARPKPEAAAAAGPADAGADVRASFIAKARRAAQAAASEAAVEAQERGNARMPNPIVIPKRSKAKAAPGAIKTSLAKHGRPLLLAVAAVVLALGTFQIYRNTQRTNGTVAIHNTVDPSAGAIAGPPPESGDPRTTQSIVPPSSLLATATPSQIASEAQPAAPQTAMAVPPPTDLPAVKAPTSVDIAAKVDARTSDVDQTAALGKTDLPAPPASLRPLPVIAASDLPVSLVPPALRQAALSGDGAALYEVGMRAAEGRGMPKDARLASRLFEKSAAQGLGPAQYRIGSLYEKGIGVTRDLDAARYWYQRGAELGNTRAMHNLAVMLAEGGSGGPNYTAALEWFKRAAEYGVRDSQFNLGVLLARGLGTQQDLSRAYTWFAVAATQGDDDASRKRDEVGSRMNAGDVAAAKAAAEKWRPRSAVQAANEVAPSSSWGEAPAKKNPRDGRV